VSAYAQVTIDGYMDRGYRALSNSESIRNLKTVGSNAGTTTFGIKYYEDIGGGMTIGGQVNTDWADIGGASQTTGLALAQTSGFANSQSFMKFSSATAGTLMMGTPNNFTLTNATAIASPEFSTGVGSTYSDQFSIANGLSTGQTGYGGTVAAGTSTGNKSSTNAGGRAIRFANTYQYVSPAINGFTFSYGTSLQNNNRTADNGFKNTVGVTEYMLRYTNGPIDAAYTSIKYDIGSNGISTATLSDAVTPVITASALAVQDNTQNLLGIKYTVMNGLTLNAGFGNFTSTAGTYAGSSKTYGGTYTKGAFDVLAVIAKVDDTTSGNNDRNMTGLGVNYNLSKTSRVYYRYDNINYSSSKDQVAGSVQKRTAIGISKSF
jgi:predicted porin